MRRFGYHSTKYVAFLSNNFLVHCSWISSDDTWSKCKDDENKHELTIESSKIFNITKPIPLTKRFGKKTSVSNR